MKIKKAEKSKRARTRTGAPGEDKRELVRKALELGKKNIEKGDMKISAADMIRLLELSGKLAGDEAERIEVRWVDPEESGAE